MKMVANGNSSACMVAASMGHLDILRYAHDNGCPWDESANMGQYVDILRYAY
jgi:hypothetical protein